MLNYTKFELIVNKHRELSKFTDEAYKLGINCEFFDKFYELIEPLMDEIFRSRYTENGVDLVLYEWLYGNTTPVTIDGVRYTLEEDDTVGIYDLLEEHFLLSENSKVVDELFTPTLDSARVNEFFDSIFGDKK